MITTLHGDCREVLPTLAPGSVQCVVTSPPYYSLRKYSDDPREIGQESTPDCLAWAAKLPPCGACYVCAMRAVFAALWRVLRDDGTVWLNLGDSYASTTSATGARGGSYATERAQWQGAATKREIPTGLKEKNLLGIPWRVALALQADGWYLRSDIIWAKNNPMPESVTDRPTRAHEYVFLLAKNARYFYDAAAIAEASTTRDTRKPYAPGQVDARGNGHDRNGGSERTTPDAGTTRNKRSVWTIATQSYPGSHYATMPEALIEPCILAGSSAQACETCGAAWGRVVEHTDELDTSAKGSTFDGGKTGVNGQGRVQPGERYVKRATGFAPRCACPAAGVDGACVVLDPFAGSGTVGKVALRYQRNAVLIELSKDYIDQHIETRTDGLQVEMFV